MHARLLAILPLGATLACAPPPPPPAASPAPARSRPVAAETPTPPPAARPPSWAQADDVELVVRRVDAEHASGPVVLLAPADSSFLLPITVGPAEALAIVLELDHVTPPRPMTHDLMRSLLDATEARLLAIRVTELRDHTFYAHLKLRVKDEVLSLDSRPSDAIALAVRAKVPILVARRVIDQAAVRDPDRAGQGQPVLGLRLQELSESLARRFGVAPGSGVLVAEVETGSPAARAGVLPGDIIRASGGEPVRDLETLLRKLDQSQQDVELALLRGEREMDLTIVLHRSAGERSPDTHP